MPAPFAIFPSDTALFVDINEGSERYKFVVANRKDVIGREQAKGNLYEVEEREIIATSFPNGATFVDIGANVGNHAIWAARTLDTPQVIAFEPTLAPHTLLCFNVTLNDVDDRVVVRKIALSSSRGHATIGNSFVNNKNIGASKISDGVGSELVSKSTGDAELSGITSLYLKIDVEGHEMQALQGLSKTIETHHPRIFIEVDDRNARKFRGWLDRNGYSIKAEFRRYKANCNYLIAHHTDSLDNVDQK